MLRGRRGFPTQQPRLPPCLPRTSCGRAPWYPVRHRVVRRPEWRPVSCRRGRRNRRPHRLGRVRGRLRTPSRRSLRPDCSVLGRASPRIPDRAVLFDRACRFLRAETRSVPPRWTAPCTRPDVHVARCVSGPHRPGHRWGRRRRPVALVARAPRPERSRADPTEPIRFRRVRYAGHATSPGSRTGPRTPVHRRAATAPRRRFGTSAHRRLRTDRRRSDPRSDRVGSRIPWRAGHPRGRALPTPRPEPAATTNRERAQRYSTPVSRSAPPRCPRRRPRDRSRRRQLRSGRTGCAPTPVGARGATNVQ